MKAPARGTRRERNPLMYRLAAGLTMNALFDWLGSRDLVGL